jgi:hypothetical protein
MEESRKSSFVCEHWRNAAHGVITCTLFELMCPKLSESLDTGRVFPKLRSPWAHSTPLLWVSTHIAHQIYLPPPTDVCHTLQVSLLTFFWGGLLCSVCYVPGQAFSPCCDIALLFAAFCMENICQLSIKLSSWLLYSLSVLSVIVSWRFSENHNQRYFHGTF